mmetsp:Transcript_88343/g.175657  ORF Transcript_88343/g.175657 Transcript_88343/m.175657 type:complete len:647 (-) Transcript_88343:209-2149(-)
MDNVVAELVDELRADVRSKLLDLLDEVAGRKVLLLDSTIVGPLDMFVKPGDLKDHGVQQWHKLSDQTVQTDCAQMIFLVRCTRLELLDMIAKQIHEDEVQGKDRLYAVVFTPRKTEQCVERLRKANVRANVQIVECGLHFFPFDRDVLSMEVPGVFHDFHVLGDPSSAFYAAKALMYLQSKFGVIPSVHAIGHAGKTIVDVMLRLRREEAVGEAVKELGPTGESSQPGVPPVVRCSKQKDTNGTSQAPKIDEVIIIDRRVDLYSVLCSQFTYQALIDMVYGVQNNQTDIGGAEWCRDRNPKVSLSPDDPFYREIRDLHIDKLGPLLQEKARAIQKTYSEKDQVITPSEMGEYIKKFKIAQSAHPLLEIHINLAHDLRDAIQRDEYLADLRLEDEITAQSSSSCLEALENAIDDQKPFHEVLRLLCLYSVVNNGVKAKHLDELKKSIVRSYGFGHVLTLCNMEKVGMLNYHQGKSVWSGIKSKFNLLVEDTQAESDISYAYSGYAPLSVRLIQMTRSLPKGWRSCQDALSLLYGPAQELQQLPDGGAAAAEARDTGQPSTVLVVFLGGITHAEVAALRRLSQLEEGRRTFLVLTTEFLSAKRLFDSMQYDITPLAPPPGSGSAGAQQPQQQQQEQRRTGFGFWPGSR